jgi:transcriptional regulator with XRE-family HTH domain
MILTAAQIRGGREALGWTLRELAARSRLSEATIRNVERGVLIKDANLFSIKRALVGAGVAFDEDGRVRIRREGK